MKAPTTGDLIMSSQVALALKVLGDRWAFLILRDVFVGVRRFEDLRRRTGAARGTLTSRLNALVENGILYRNPYQSSPTRYEYRLTDKGMDLYSTALVSWTWETTWGGEHQLPILLTHNACGKATEPSLCCAHCKVAIDVRDVSFSPGPGTHQAASTPPRFQRRYRAKSEHPEGVDTAFFHIVDVIGDRWAGLVFAAVLFGLRRYDDIGNALGIATNILADRLKRLVASGVLERRPYQTRPTRHEYRLTEKGRALYPFALTLHQWADKWLLVADNAPLVLTHEPCGKTLNAVVTCGECGDALAPGDIHFDRNPTPDTGSVGVDAG